LRRTHFTAREQPQDLATLRLGNRLEHLHISSLAEASALAYISIC
jgi:hypothetical protein